MGFSLKLTVRQLTLAGTRMVLNIPNEWYLAENQRFGILEFFNRIGQLRKFKKKQGECLFLTIVFNIFTD